MKFLPLTDQGTKHIIQSRPRCSFCCSSYAAVYVKMKLNSFPKPYCLLHYYTTRACRIDTRNVKPIEAELNNQLKVFKDFFLVVFEELRKEIHDQTILEIDPLSTLH